MKYYEKQILASVAFTKDGFKAYECDFDTEAIKFRKPKTDNPERYLDYEYVVIYPDGSSKKYR